MPNSPSLKYKRCFPLSITDHSRLGTRLFCFWLQDQGAGALAALEAKKAELGFEEVQYNESIGKLSLVGAGMKSNPGVSFKFFDALSTAGINIEMISTSEIRISVITDIENLDEAVRAVHSAFDLDTEGEATVYGGTGR